MKRVCTWLLLSLSLTLTSAEYVSSDQTLSVYYFPRPPLYITNSDGSAGGFLNEIARLIFNDAEIPFEFKEMPSKRVLENIKSGEYACGVGWFKTPERQEFACFSDPIYQDIPFGVVIDREKAKMIPPAPTIAQLFKADLVLGVIDGFSYGSWADESIKSLSPKTNKLTGEQGHLLKLMTVGRCHYTLMGVEEAAWQLKNNEELGARLQIMKISDAPAGNFRYIMFSKGVDKSVLDRVNASIARALKTDVYAKLTDFSSLMAAQ